MQGVRTLVFRSSGFCCSIALLDYGNTGVYQNGGSLILETFAAKHIMTGSL